MRRAGCDARQRPRPRPPSRPRPRRATRCALHRDSRRSMGGRDTVEPTSCAAHSNAVREAVDSPCIGRTPVPSSSSRPASSSRCPRSRCCPARAGADSCSRPGGPGQGHGCCARRAGSCGCWSGPRRRQTCASSRRPLMNASAVSSECASHARAAGCLLGPCRQMRMAEPINRLHTKAAGLARGVRSVLWISRTQRVPERISACSTQLLGE